MEVEFFVVAENSKGKMNDRAVHITVLAPGTIVLETTLALKAIATVAVEPKVHPREEPGMVILHQPIQREGLPDITHVELWPRCMPDGLVFRVGDKIELDVQNYRPEKLNFARSVRVISFRKLGREQGKVCVIKKDQGGFGFVHSVYRDQDIYFRLSEVLGPAGDAFLPEDKVMMNLSISFEPHMEEAKSGAARLRAIRCRVVGDGSVEKGVSALSIDDVPLQRGCVGVILRDSNKRDAPGLIRLLPSGQNGASEGGEDSLSSTIVHQTELIEAVEEFKSAPFWKEVVVESLTAARRNLIHTLLDEKYPGIAHENARGAASGAGKKLRLWKMQEAEYQKWRNTRKTDEPDEPVSPRESPRNLSGLSNAKDESDGLLFVRSDTILDMGPLAKDLTVTFDIYFDQASNKRIARAVRLTDEAVAAEHGSGAAGEQFGILDCVFSRGGRFGHIRCIPSDEKLHWHGSGAAPGTDEASLNEGVEVGFLLRRRGGVRVAVNIRLLPPHESQSREARLDGVCLGMVTDDYSVVLVDVSQCPLLKKKYWNMERVRDLVNGGQSMMGGDMHMHLGGEAGAETGSADARYLPSLCRFPVPVDVLEMEGLRATLQPGDLVQCQAVVNWVVQRHPLRLCSVAPLPGDGASLGPKLKGSIHRQSVRMRGASAMAFAAAGENIDFCEIRDETPGQEGGLYYCKLEEIRPVTESGSVQQGDDVMFYPFGPLGAALSVQVVPRLQERDGIIFNRPRTINLSIKEAQAKSGFKGVTMAKVGSDNNIFSLPSFLP